MGGASLRMAVERSQRKATASDLRNHSPPPFSLQVLFFITVSALSIIFRFQVSFTQPHVDLGIYLSNYYTRWRFIEKQKTPSLLSGWRCPRWAPHGGCFVSRMTREAPGHSYSEVICTARVWAVGYIKTSILGYVVTKNSLSA